MKFALILESSAQQSYSIRNKCAFKYGTDEIYEWHSSIRVGNEMTSMGPFAYPFIFNGDYINWEEQVDLPAADYDIIFCAGEYHYNELRKLEEINNSKKKFLPKTGYLYFDYLSKNNKELKKEDFVLVAPSWNYNKKIF